MEKKILYNTHEILLKVLLNTGSRIIDGSQEVLTHTLQCLVDDAALLENTSLTDSELIVAINDFTIQAQRRIDVIGTPEDSPIVAQLLAMGFTF